ITAMFGNRAKQRARRIGVRTRTGAGLHRCRLDLDFGRVIRLGYLSLRTLDTAAGNRLGLGPRSAMGPGLGVVAKEQRLRWLGAPAARSAIRSTHGYPQLVG